MIKKSGCSINDALRTYTEHIALQIKNAISTVNNHKPAASPAKGGIAVTTINHKLLCTGGGAFNTFLIERLKTHLAELNIDVIIPGEKLIKYKEALIMALMGVLRWREETNVLASVTGAQRDSIGGAVWMGQEE